MGIMADSYKATHFQQYPDATKIVAYGEFRTGFEHDIEDNRIAIYGVQFITERVLLRKWTMKDVELAEAFYKTHMAPKYSQFPFPKHLFMKFVLENNGYFPIKFEALKDGSCVHAHVPVYQITAEGEYSPLCTFLESILTMIWYPATVATLARRVRDSIELSFTETTPEGRSHLLIESRLHDFGFRACTTIDQAVIGGCAHLLSFTGTDTMPAAFYAQFMLNNGVPIGNSIPATEHSVMTAWSTETEAIRKMIDLHGSEIFACVVDSYDYAHALEEILPCIAKEKAEKGGFMVLRPDSGDPAEAVVQALEAADQVFGSSTNVKGYRVLNGCGVIQGDGMSSQSITYVLQKIKEAKFSVENCAFGMGGGLLQKVNRDTMSFATKLSQITYSNGKRRNVMKTPRSDQEKFSLPGELAVKRVSGIPTVFPKDCVQTEDNLLQVVYDHGPVEGLKWDDFNTVRNRLAQEWNSMSKTHDAISQELREKMNTFIQSHNTTITTTSINSVNNQK
eukprot:g6124.t1